MTWKIRVDTINIIFYQVRTKTSSHIIKNNKKVFLFCSHWFILQKQRQQIWKNFFVNVVKNPVNNFQIFLKQKTQSDDNILWKMSKAIIKYVTTNPSSVKLFENKLLSKVDLFQMTEKLSRFSKVTTLQRSQLLFMSLSQNSK